jgi:predicted PurR-regulated permease PerM/GNAT superfamily N-acetyltransferase
MNQSEQAWDSGTKRIVALIVLALLALAAYRLQAFLPPLVLAFLLAFILDPVVDFLEARAKMTRTVATVAVFAVLVLGLLAAPAGAVPPLLRAARSLNLDFARIAADLERLLARPIEFLGREWDLREVYQQLRAQINAFSSAVLSGTLNVVVEVASTLFWAVFILLSSFYLVRDADRIVAWADSLAPTSLQDDFVRLRLRVTHVWHAFLRGQLLMAVLLALLTTLADLAVGLPNALALGVLAGVMEFVPSIGPIIAAVPAVAVAFFEGSSWIPLSNLWFAVLVLGLYLVIQQVEGNVLLPRVMGRSLDLHPLIVLVALIAGGILAGILGVLLAAPTVATLKVLGNYVFCRLTDRDPFPPAAFPPPTRRGLGRKARDRVRAWVLSGQWVTRAARPEDRAAAERICAEIWGGEDYVPGVWDEWVSDPYGELTVVERKGQVVALGKLTRMADGEWWLEGLRVDPAFRFLGLARRLQAYQVGLAERIGQGALRLGTGSHNRAVLRNVSRGGFRRVAEYLFYGGDVLPGPCALSPLTMDDLGAVWGLVEGSPIYRAAGGLYEVHWRWMDLTRERLATHLAAGEVWGLHLDGRLAAVTVAPARPGANRLTLGYLDGEPEGLTALAVGARVLAGQQGHADGVRVRPLAFPPLLEALEAAGVTRDWEHSLYIFERSLTGGNDHEGKRH